MSKQEQVTPDGFNAAHNKHEDSKDNIVQEESIQQSQPVGKQLTLMETYRSYEPSYSAEMERKLVRKIDIRLLPLIVIIYLFNYLDRNSIVQARLYGLQEDTNVHGAVYQTAISIFSAGYIAMQIPSTLIMTKMRPHIFLPGCIIVWALVSGCTSATSSPAGLLVVRFFLGIVEAPFFPSAIFYLSCWYTKKELGKRMALLICGILLSNCFAGLISAGILSGMQSVGHLASWRWLFILEGLATILIGILAFFCLPDYPGTTKWLSEVERIIAQGRLAADAGAEEAIGEEHVPFKTSVFLAFKDYRVWLFACMQMATTATISFSHFLPTLISLLGFSDRTVTLLLTAPPYAFAFVWAISLAWSADIWQKRSVFALICAVVAIGGMVPNIALSDQAWARYALNFPVASGTFGIYATTYAWLSSTIIQPRVKRAAAIGIANTCANLASLYANYFWLDQYGPYFKVSWGCLLAFQMLGVACIFALRWSLKRANAKFDRLAAEVDINDEVALSRLDLDEQRAVLNGFRFVI